VTSLLQILLQQGHAVRGGAVSAHAGTGTAGTSVGAPEVPRAVRY
jgi:hypothetical protein